MSQVFPLLDNATMNGCHFVQVCGSFSGQGFSQSVVTGMGKTWN